MSEHDTRPSRRPHSSRVGSSPDHRGGFAEPVRSAWSPSSAGARAGSQPGNYLKVLGSHPDPLEREAHSLSQRLTQPQAPQRGATRALSTPAGQGGQPLPGALRAYFEPRLGADLSGVRIHAGPEADAATRAQRARAMTQHQDLHFRAGLYQPDSAEGRRLLAHELTHVVQQSGGGGAVRLSATPGALQRDEEGSKQSGAASAHTQTPAPDPDDITDTVVADVSALAVQASKDKKTLLPEKFITDSLVDWHNNPKLDWTIQGIVAEYENFGGDDTSTIAAWATTTLIEALEDLFIGDSKTSSLDLLGAAKSKSYREFKWEKDDFPGGDKGKNEGMASSLSSDLSGIRAQRRANLGSDAVLTESWVSAQTSKNKTDLAKYISDQLEAIPSEIPAPKDEKLNKHALKSLKEMHAAAALDGVSLEVFDGYREPETSKKLAAASGNRSAVAKFSAHNLGLAVDFKMSSPGKAFSEAMTQPFDKVVKMRESPAHKWLFVKGARYGWFPYQEEPWHFEYNPEGFRDTFWSEASEDLRKGLNDARTKEEEAKQKAQEAAAKKKAKKK